MAYHDTQNDYRFLYYQLRKQYQIFNSKTVFRYMFIFYYHSYIRKINPALNERQTKRENVPKCHKRLL